MSQQRSSSRADALMLPPIVSSDTSATTALKQTKRARPKATAMKLARKVLETPSTPHIPAEILQTIFRSLSMYDLLRCRRVCKTWHATLPGNDPSLQATLFTPSRPALVAAPNATPRLTFTVNVEVFLINDERELPQLGFSIILTEKVKRINMPADRSLHPLILSFPFETGIVNKHFMDWQRKCPSVAFKDLDHLQGMLSSRKNYLKAGNWKDQLCCVPPLEQVVVQMAWFREKGQGEDETENKLKF